MGEVPLQTIRSCATCTSLYPRLSARWTTRGSFPPNLKGNSMICAPHNAAKLIALGRLTFYERVVVHRAVLSGRSMSAHTQSYTLDPEPYNLDYNPRCPVTVNHKT